MTGSTPLAGGSDLEGLLAVQTTRVSELARQLAGVHAASEATNADDEHDPEGATIAFERQLLVSLLDAARRTEGELRAALERRGTPGATLCRVCGAPIPADRLEARPQATTCVPCADLS